MSDVLQETTVHRRKLIVKMCSELDTLHEVMLHEQ